MTQEVDLREYDNGDRLMITLESGEEFDVQVVGWDGDPATDYSNGWKRLTLEGESIWEQVNNRVESEVLYAYQEYTIGRGTPKNVELQGTVWEGETPETSVPKYNPIGVISDIESAYGGGV